MTKLKATALLMLTASALALSACEPQPPYWTEVCTKAHDETRFEMSNMCLGGLSFDGNGFEVAPGKLQMCNVTHHICDQYERQCVIDPKYKGLERDCTGGNSRTRLEE